MAHFNINELESEIDKVILESMIDKNNSKTQPQSPLKQPRERIESSSSRKTVNNVMLPMDRFSNWVSAILVVTFDIEMGQCLEAVYPSKSHVKLTPNECSNICYMSFPDSNSGFLGDTQFHFRLKQDEMSSSLFVPSPPVNKLQKAPTMASMVNKKHLNGIWTNMNSTLFNKTISCEEYNSKILNSFNVNN
jgi:hypothetical protein